VTQPLLESALERGFTVRSPHDPAQNPRRCSSSCTRSDVHRVGSPLDEAMAVLDAMQGAR
jgi:hypothetical protein